VEKPLEAGGCHDGREWWGARNAGKRHRVASIQRPPATIMVGDDASALLYVVHGCIIGGY